LGVALRKPLPTSLSLSLSHSSPYSSKQIPTRNVVGRFHSLENVRVSNFQRIRNCTQKLFLQTESQEGFFVEKLHKKEENKTELMI
jgi:hypothetical protein